MQNKMIRMITALLKWKNSGGFHCCPTDMTVSESALSRRDQKIARLYVQGTSKERVGAYLRQLLRWAGTFVACVTSAWVLTGCGPTYVLVSHADGTRSLYECTKAGERLIVDHGRPGRDGRGVIMPNMRSEDPRFVVLEAQMGIGLTPIRETSDPCQHKKK